MTTKKIFPVLLTFIFFFPTALLAQENPVVLKVKGISCPFCVYGIEKKLKKVPTIASVQSNYKESTFVIEPKQGASIDIAAIHQAVIDAGFTPVSINLTLKGTLTMWKNRTAFKVAGSGQIFVLVELTSKEPHEWLSQEKLNQLKSLSQQGKKPLILEGVAHSHGEMPTALAVTKFKAAP